MYNDGHFSGQGNSDSLSLTSFQCIQGINQLNWNPNPSLLDLLTEALLNQSPPYSEKPLGNSIISMERIY